MARVLTLQYKDLEIPVILKGFSRDVLYGKSIVEKIPTSNKIKPLI